MLCLRQNQRLYPLHSLVDPEKEGKRFLINYPPKGFVIFLGLGCGYHIEPYLAFTEVTTLLIIDTDIQVLYAVLCRIDLHKFFLDPRVFLLIDPSKEELEDFFLSHYLPSLSGDIQTVPLRSRINLAMEFFQPCIEVFHKGMETLSNDFTVQSHFGKKWFANSLANLPIAEKATLTISPKAKVCITAAGPSLEESIPKLKTIRKEALLIATDTSLPALLEQDILPDLVLSIDCQHISYHHFLRGLPEEVPLILDLASPPLLARITSKLLFFASPHPFSRYIRTYWRQFPPLDTSGGNVTHTAVSLALALQAQQVYLFGADFSYPQGKSYARGTYLYPYFFQKSNRFLPIEASFIHFLFSHPLLKRLSSVKGIQYLPPRMESYRTLLEEVIERSSLSLIKNPFEIPSMAISNPNAHSTLVSFFSAGASPCSWREFLLDYQRKIQTLPKPSDPVISYFHSLDSNQRNLWTTLLPISAVVLREKANGEPLPSQLLLESREWALERIERTLQV
ncbi:MAG: 6-hydroxymethylpterin diphosphokinase MptE-like protein [Spirochaetales bacterium]